MIRSGAMAFKTYDPESLGSALPLKRGQFTLDCQIHQNRSLEVDLYDISIGTSNIDRLA